MTAVVGILNKHGIAIAADSAITVGNYRNNRKVYNYANKIFMLSKKNPVGIAIYNNATMMGIPWETLIKEYRKHLHRHGYETLSMYKSAFFAWLAEHNYFIEDDGKAHIMNDLLNFAHAVKNDLCKKGVQSNQLNANFLAYLQNYIDSVIPKQNVIDSIKDIDENKTKLLINSLVREATKIIFQHLNIDISEAKNRDLLASAYFEFLKHDQFTQFSGLIFFGFGEEEIFPRILPVNVSIVVDNKIRMIDDKAKAAGISDSMNACIQPFAQTDVIDTILQGVSPRLKSISTDTFKKFIQGFAKDIQSINGLPDEVKNHINLLDLKKLEEIHLQYFENIIHDNYVRPLMSTVSQLSKEDLAEMAESLVYLTYLKRRFTFAEESVGGPVDVAIVTKGDGFIWIKRKHYFDPELNQHYIKKLL